MANVRIILFQICFEETLHFVIGNHSGHIIVKVYVGSAVDEQNGILDFSRPGQQRLVQEALAADDVPAVCGIAAALVIAARAYPRWRNNLPR